MNIVAFDWVAYMLILQSFPILLILLERTIVKNEKKDVIWLDQRKIVFTQILLLGLMWLIYGGYTTDAPRYLTRFEHNPFGFEEENLFWLAGNLLSKIFTDPWPLKILSCVCSITISLGYMVNADLVDQKSKSILIWLSVLLPSLYFLEGNIIRQGLSVGIMLFAIFFIEKGRWYLALAVSLLAFGIHNYSVVLIVIFFGARFIPNFGFLTLCIGLVIGLYGEAMFQFFGIDIASYVAYSGKTFGHFDKLFVYMAISAILLYYRYTAKIITKKEKYWIDVYCYFLSAALIFIQHEVPFERLSTYAEILLPLSLLCFFKHKLLNSKMLLPVIMSVNIGAILLWQYESILMTMGFI